MTEMDFIYFKTGKESIIEISEEDNPWKVILKAGNPFETDIIVFCNEVELTTQTAFQSDGTIITNHDNVDSLIMVTDVTERIKLEDMKERLICDKLAIMSSQQALLLKSMMANDYLHKSNYQLTEEEHDILHQVSIKIIKREDYNLELMISLDKIISNAMKNQI